MSAPITVKRDGRNPEWPFRWECAECENRADEAPSLMDLLSMPESMGYGGTIAAAADAGRKHVREDHLLPRLRERLLEGASAAPEKALLTVTQMRAALDRIEARNVAANKEEATR